MTPERNDDDASIIRPNWHNHAIGEPCEVCDESAPVADSQALIPSDRRISRFRKLSSTELAANGAEYDEATYGIPNLTDPFSRPQLNAPADDDPFIVDAEDVVELKPAKAMLNGTVPGDDATIPGDDDFLGMDFMPADDLREIGMALINKYPEKWRYIGSDQHPIDFMWKREGGGTGGMVTLGKCVKPSGLAKHYGGASFVIWLGADNCRAAALNNFQLEALVYHELCHAMINEKGKDTSVPHDFEGFLAELDIYGPWRTALKWASEKLAAAKQFGLWDTLEDEPED